MPISKDEARQIAQGFLETSHELGTWRFAHWAELSPTARRTIEDAEWDLLNYSSSLVTAAVGIVLADMQTDLKAITDATAQARKAIAKITRVKSILTVSAAFITLGGAIASGHPAAIAETARAALKAVKEAGPKPK